MSRCAQEIEDPSPATPLSGAGAAPIRRSRSARWRAGVLIAVHVLLALHIGQWLATGSTMTPLEPSEALEFSKQGIVNAGAVLFLLAILSTLVLGRWFCGWACHVVALQDLCRWLLGKVGIRPKPVNLGLLAVVPWLAFVYMFLAPMIQRLLFGQSLAPTGTHFRTSEFWATFPGLATAILTFAVCGFAIVYLLGAKGFCTYGCPYGGIFGVVDQLAPMRIRVTDACEGCGHCTASCSSNVRVHQEVRDHGMVVDPGCMKCMDCVSVCPKDALYVGFGLPAILAPDRRAKSGRARAEARGGAREAILRTLVLAAFIVGTQAVLMQFDAPLDARLLWITSGLCLVVAVLFRGRSKRPAGQAWHEEALLGAAFLAALWSMRGFQGMVPLLFALGLSAILAFGLLQALRALTGRSSFVQGFQLVRGGRSTKPGVVFAACFLPVLALWGFAGLSRWRAESDARAAQVAWDEGLRRAYDDDLQGALASFERVLALRPDHVAARENLAGMLCAVGRFEEGVAQYELALAQRDDAGTRRMLARALRELGRIDEARAQERAAELLERR